MQESTLAELENLFLALSDKTRLRLLALMAGGEVSVGFLADSLGESQPKTSRHLAYLRNAGLVVARRDGKWIYYNIEQPSDSVVERILSVTIETIGGGNGDPQSDYFPEPGVAGDEFVAYKDDTYAETYESDYVPNEMPIYLL